MTKQPPRKRPGSKMALMHDVAREAGVSMMTVSRVLRDPDKVSDAMRRRVLKVVEDFDYLPNRLASSLSSNRSMVVGLILPSLDNSIFAQTLKGIADVIRPAGLQLMVAESGYDPLDEERLITAFLIHRVAGLVLHNTEHTPKTVRLIRQAAIPVVENGNLPAAPLDMAVSYSNFAAARAMTLHLGRLGYRKIAIASLQTARNERSRSRVAGYLAALEELGQPRDPRLIVESSRGLAAGAEAVARALALDPGIDALFCAGDVLAAGALFECQRRGWAVPGRLALASFDDVDLLAQTTPTVTTVRLPRYEIGKRTAEMLLERMRGNGAAPQEGTVVDLKFEIIQRQSA